MNLSATAVQVPRRELGPGVGVHARADDRAHTRAGDLERRRRPSAQPPDQHVPGDDLGERRAADVPGAHVEQPEGVSPLLRPVPPHPFILPERTIMSRPSPQCGTSSG